MTLTLYLLRHAKSGKDNPRLADIDRPLNERGRYEAQAVADHMAAHRQQPAHIICSSAQRTRETLMPILQVLRANATIDLTRRLYDVGADALLDVIREQAELASLMLVGHNPGLEELARRLPSSGDPQLLGKLGAMFPPASLAVIEFDAPDWSQARGGAGRLIGFECPD